MIGLCIRLNNITVEIMKYGSIYEEKALIELMVEVITRNYGMERNNKLIEMTNSPKSTMCSLIH
jgi:alanine-alpha-ketoisovalerate/valine-pyruvate aminotransferase